MSTVLPAGISAGGRRVFTFAALMTIFMQGINISIPNAALSHIQGTLSMADDEIGWLFTSYIAGSVIVMPLTPWLAGRFGRKKVFLISLVVFAVGLVLDTVVTTPIQFVAARVVQGAGSGPLAPVSMVMLLELWTPARRAQIGIAAGACGLAGISSGPGVGGWSSEFHGWQSIYYFSLPLAAFSFLVAALLMVEKKAEKKPSFDFFGFAMISLGMIALQMLLDRGERMEWFASKEIWAEAIASVTGFYLFAVHVLTGKAHFFDKGLLGDRNFVVSTIMYFGVGFVLLPTLALTSPMLEELLNYPVDTTGYMAIPRGVALVGSLVLMGFVPAWIDIRLFVIGGLAIVSYANWRMLDYSPAMDWSPVAIAGLLQGVGLAMAISALSKTAFSTVDQKLHPEGGMIFNLSRLYGSTIGIAVVQIFFYVNTQAMHLALAKDLAPYRAAAHLTAAPDKHGLAMLNDMITGQASVVAIIGQFKILLVAALVVSPLTLLLRKPRPAGAVRAVQATISPAILSKIRPALTVLVAISALAFLSGCMVGPNYARPAGPASKAYDQPAQKQLSTGGGDTNAPHISLGQKIEGNWWAAFGSAKLDEVMRQAVDGNFDLTAVDATIAEANEAVVGARGGLYPQIDYAGQMGYQRSYPPGASHSATSAFYSVGLLASFDFDVFGGTKRLVEREAALAEFQKRRYDAAYLTLTGDIADQAILLASARAQINAVEILLGDDRKNLELVRLARISGSAAQVDVALAQTQLSQDETLLPPLAQKCAVASHALSVLAGKGPNDWVPPNFDLTDFTLPLNLPVTLPSEAARNRPDILEAEAELHAASAAIGMATADLYPHLTLSGFVSQAALGMSSPFGAGTALWSIGTELAGPVFHGGTLQANRRGAVDGYHASLATYRQTVVTSLGQVADVLQAIHHDADEYSAQDRALDSAAISLRLNREGFREGEVSVLEVLISERAYEQALLGHIQAKTAQYLDTTQLFVALGGNSAGAFEQRTEIDRGVQADSK
jgi:MFS transporter, DHA2 family, multidrug resistance protein